MGYAQNIQYVIPLVHLIPFQSLGNFPIDCYLPKTLRVVLNVEDSLDVQYDY